MGVRDAPATSKSPSRASSKAAPSCGRSVRVPLINSSNTCSHPSRPWPGPAQRALYCLHRLFAPHIRTRPQPYGRASKTMLNGVSVARRTLRKPPAMTASRSFASPACAPNAAPTSCDSDVGTQTSVEAA